MATCIALCQAGWASAETTIWNDVSNAWNAGVWTAGVPEAGDDVLLATPGVTVFYLSAVNPTLSKLTVNAVGGTQLLQARDSLTAVEEIIGDNAAGTFTQTGGVNTVAGTTTTQGLTLGRTIGGAGTYEISGGTLRANFVTVGGGGSGTSFGTGTFKQTGGTVDLVTIGTVGELLVGDATGSTGHYELSAGSLLTRSTFVAVSPDGSGARTFTQTGGSHQIAGSLNLGGFVGGGAATTGSYALGGLATTSLTAASENLGLSGSGTFVHSNGTNQVSGALSLGGYNGGSATASGSYTLSGTSGSALSVVDEFVGVSGVGTFTQEGGAHTISGGLVIGALAGSVGTYHLKSGSLTAAGEFVGNPGQGTFLHSGGTNTVNGQLWIDAGGSAASSGSYTISGGGLTTNGAGLVPGLLNAGTFTLQSGGTATVNGTGSNAGLENQGTFTMSGGTLAGSAPKINAGVFTGHGLITGAGALINRGSMTFSGGTTTVDSDVVIDAGFTLEVTGIVAVFNGTVTNEGIFKTTAASSVFNGDVAIGGTFLSDPSVQTYYGDVTVSSNGALVSPEPGGDIWQIGYDLIVESVNRTGWSTLLGELEFFTPSGLGTGDHKLVYAGVDLGQTADGYLDNFAWGAVEVAADSRLVNTNDAALYTEELRLGGGTAQIATFTGDLAIYYDPSAPANGYLGGQTYGFGSGNGFVAPVPEPSTLGLLALGLLGLARRRR